MFVKIMTGDNIADSSYLAPYELYETPTVRFETRPWEGALENTPRNIIDGGTLKMAHWACMKVDGYNYDALCPGNVYVLNGEGKTVDTWAPNS